MRQIANVLNSSLEWKLFDMCCTPHRLRHLIDIESQQCLLSDTSPLLILDLKAMILMNHEQGRRNFWARVNVNFVLCLSGSVPSIGRKGSNPMCPIKSLLLLATGRPTFVDCPIAVIPVAYAHVMIFNYNRLTFQFAFVSVSNVF